MNLSIPINNDRESYSYALRQLMSSPHFAYGVDYLAGLLSSTDRYKAVETDKGVEVLNRDPVTIKLRRRLSNLATPNQTLKTYFSHGFYTGNGFIDISDDANWSNCNPFDMISFRFEGTKYFYSYSKKKVFLNNEVLHFMPRTIDGLIGVDPRYLYGSHLTLIQTCQRYLVNYFRKGVAIQGYLEIPEAVSDNQKVQIRESLASLTSNDDNSITFPALPPGVKLTPFTTNNNQQTQILETITYTEKVTSQILGCLPDLISGTGDQEKIREDTIRGPIRQIIAEQEQEFTYKLCSAAEILAGQFVAFDDDSLLRGSLAIRQLELQEVNSGVRLPNDYAAKYDLQYVPGGDIPRIPVAVSQPAEQPTNVKKESVNPEVAGTGGVQEPLNFSLIPLVEDIAKRVQAKEDKAFSKSDTKPQQEWETWRVNFASEQGRYLADALQPLASATATPIDIEAISTRYTTAVAGRDLDDSSRTDLAQILKETICPN